MEVVYLGHDSVRPPNLLQTYTKHQQMKLAFLLNITNENLSFNLYRKFQVDLDKSQDFVTVLPEILLLDMVTVIGQRRVLESRIVTFLVIIFPFMD